MRLEFCKFIDEKINSKQHFDVKVVADHVNNELLSDRVIERQKLYSVECVRLRMAENSYKHGKHCKGIHTDGHERADIVQDRENFVKKIRLIRSDSYFENGENVLDKDEWLAARIADELVTYLTFYHDESVFYKWDHHSFGWHSKQCHPLLPKSKGQGCN